ncbi:hypothetical protein PANT_27d00049 [Moesziomyces antarcticus T-34]|uniref:DNA repair protein rad9 n=1 Tax=Pseudozyma antarctica (strain T-34) TaxID=1151754 RepID=M9M1U4_PSEA3|nr:hypothetical protein PANT_27d00049 [Moesziomyces antarcticus T-34]
MNAVISASDIKTFYSALNCLSRFSDTFWLQCSRLNNGQAQIRLSAINATNSAFCMFVFDPDFFLSVATQASAKVECQIHLKSILSILRSRGRTVERLELDLTDSGSECRFTVALHCQHGILKVHRLTYEPKRGLLPTADPNPPNFFCIAAATATEWTDHFLSSNRNGEITFACTPSTCVARSKDDDSPDPKGGLRRAIHTEVKIAVDEFREYAVLDACALTFSLREFKATVALAEALGVALEVNFSDGDEPLFVRLRVENAVAAEFVIATTRPDRTNAPDKEAAPAAVARSVSSSVAPPAARETQRQTESSDASIAPPPPVRPPVESTPVNPVQAQAPLFFPGASQPSQPEPEEQTQPLPPSPQFVQPTPVARGGDPGEFLAPSESDTESEPDPAAPRKRFKPLF